MNKLTPEEEKIIVHKGTQAPFSGEYNEHFRDGVYLCRRCDAPLYDSRDKFRSDCGWLSFDDEIKGAVKRTPDADGIREEIVCANCGAHLGHIFTGEKITPKDTRHCANSLSLRFVPRTFAPGEKHLAVFGGGCFWCLDAVFSRVKGVARVDAGYAGGHKDNPNYEEVSAGGTGHAETVRIAYDPAVVGYNELLRIFFHAHDPTELNKQGNDIGTQYRSIILYFVWEQKLAAEKMIEELTKRNKYGRPIVTELGFLVKFFPAEGYHQKYFEKNPEAAYCRAVIKPKLEKLKNAHP